MSANEFLPWVRRAAPEAQPEAPVIDDATDAATYDALAPKLDAVVAEYDLVTHVRRT